MQINRQLALAIHLPPQETLADFYWGENALLKQALEAALKKTGERFLFLWGASGHGKSHLLQGCCQSMDTQETVAYLPLALLKQWGPSSIDGYGHQSLIAIDDIDSIAGDDAWEEALFHLFNRVRDNGETTLLITAKTPPANTLVKLNDLRSRLSWGLIIQIHELNDDLKVTALQHQARKRGFELSQPAALFLIKRCARSMHTLHDILDRLDKASLALQRKITIPFIKTVLEI